MTEIAILARSNPGFKLDFANATFTANCMPNGTLLQDTVTYSDYARLDVSSVTVRVRQHDAGVHSLQF